MGKKFLFITIATVLVVTPGAFFSFKYLKTEPLPVPIKGEFTIGMSAVVGENYLTLSGYTSPLATVKLSSSAGSIKKETQADNSGFFIFNFVQLPPKPGELILLAQDSNGFVSSPVFLPQPPPNRNVHIKNVLLSPTIAVGKGEINPGETVSAAGKTFPNSKVLVYLYEEETKSWWLSLQKIIVKPAMAKMAPKLEIAANKSGDFEFSLPTTQPAIQRLFVAAIRQEDYSPKSFTLAFKILSRWGKLSNLFKKVSEEISLSLGRIFTNLLIVITVEMIILTFLATKIILNKRRSPEE